MLTAIEYNTSRTKDYSPFLSEKLSTLVGQVRVRMRILGRGWVKFHIFVDTPFKGTVQCLKYSLNFQDVKNIILFKNLNTQI